ncbi:AAA family ATPase [Aliivibrio fischeri]|uniref:AAA family ATPase n=1 Tax=Aliivibrio fischeri TaxID=668 RepID=UPI001F351D0C|nr:AAA family ATPase [Aliivibrio fischeri]MCE7567559.1 AAA family ATPase [Aliivibrio fischeri]
MKVVSSWNPKGGQGKSLFTINLAAAATQLGLKALVICQDQQGTAMLYHKAGNLPFDVINEIPKERPDVDIVFIDHQASDWEVPKSKFILMPLKPARDQYATYIDAYKRAEASGKTILTVVTDGSAHRADEKATTEALQKKGAYVVPSSGVFSRAAGQYRTIFDEQLNKAYKIGQRRAEMQQILARILMKEGE